MFNKLIKDEEIKFVFLEFSDLFGVVKGIYLPINKLNNALKSGVNLDGSSIKCLAKTRNSDKILMVDKSSFYLLPNNVLAFVCNLKSSFDTGTNLKKICNKFYKKGYQIMVGAELEFFLFEQKDPKADLNQLEYVGYFSEINIKKLNALNEIANFLNEQGFEVETIHHECAKNQYELNFKFDTPIQIANKVTVAKQIIKHIAKKHNLYASFMPKPIEGLAGSGMHINISVWKNGKNIFYDKLKVGNLSDFARKFTEGVANHIGAICAFSNQNINSYKRLRAKMETPINVKIGYKDRLSAFRVPSFNENSARVEFRFPDISCQIYLTLSSMLMSAYENLFLKNSSLEKFEILPKNLLESLTYLKNDKLLSRLVPKSYFSEIQNQINEYESQITKFEIDNYL